MAPEEKKDWAVALLQQKEKELGRLPKKEDFDPVTRSRVKAFLGPWPRALEAAGLKPSAPKAAGNKKRKQPKAAAGRAGDSRRQRRASQ